MIAEVPALVAELAPGLVAGGAAGVACVWTTRPLFLVFGADARKPACVVQLGPRDELERIHGILEELHRRLPGLVPAPLACAPWRDGGHVLIQSGLAGMPWFRLAGRIRGPEGWDRLRDRALEALGRLHAAIRDVPGWSTLVSPGDELRRRVAACRRRGVALSTRMLDRARAWADCLDELGTSVRPWQHGDYCVNNLLIDDAGLGIIDFEEFGGTAVPLHDVFGLAVSIHLLAPSGAGGRPLAGEIAACLRPGRAAGEPIQEAFVPGLFLHHLLWRVDQGLNRRRDSLVAVLLGMVERLADSPGDIRPGPAGRADGRATAGPAGDLSWAER